MGDPAPIVALPDSHGTEVRLGGPASRGRLVVFLPAAFTPVCGGELRDLAGLAERLELEGQGREVPGVEVLGVSCDAMTTLRAWQEAEDAASVRLVSDFWPHGAAARAYGVFDGEHGIARRGSFLLDAAGVVRWRTESPAGMARDVAGYERAVSELLAGGLPTGGSPGLRGR